MDVRAHEKAPRTTTDVGLRARGGLECLAMNPSGDDTNLVLPGCHAPK